MAMAASAGRARSARALQIYVKIATAAARRRLGHAGVLHEGRGDYVRARESHEEALRIRRDLGDERQLAQSYDNVGYVLFMEGQYDNALVYWQQGLDRRRKIGEKGGIILSTQNMGFLQITQALGKALKSSWRRCSLAANRLPDAWGVSSEPGVSPSTTPLRARSTSFEEAWRATARTTLYRGIHPEAGCSLLAGPSRRGQGSSMRRKRGCATGNRSVPPTTRPARRWHGPWVQESARRALDLSRACDREGGPSRMLRAASP